MKDNHSHSEQPPPISKEIDIQHNRKKRQTSITNLSQKNLTLKTYNKRRN